MVWITRCITCGFRRDSWCDSRRFFARDARRKDAYFDLLICGARKTCVVAKTAEKLAIRVGRFCLFSVICGDF